MLGDPYFFRPISSFSGSFNYTTERIKKILYVGSFNFFSLTIPMESNWYMNKGVRDLEVTSFKVNST